MCKVSSFVFLSFQLFFFILLLLLLLFLFYVLFLLHISLWIAVSVTLVALQFLLRRVRSVLYVLCYECLSK